MIERDGCPGNRRTVTGTALRRRRNVRSRLDLGILQEVGTAMAGRATGQAGMAHGGRRPGRIPLGVTGVALPRHRNVRRRLGQGIDRYEGTSVTGRTIANGQRSRRAGMAHRGLTEGAVIFVTAVALRRRRNVCRRFAECIRSVVTSRAFADRTRIVHKSCGCPGCGRCMTGIALAGIGNVCGRLDLSVDRQIGTTVTGRTIACNSHTARRVVHLGRGECRIVLVAIITGIACRRQVRGRLGQGIRPVVAGAARTSNHPRVGIACRFPRYRSMAGVAGLRTGWNVLCRASLGIHRCVATVMTAQTVVRRTRMTHRSRGKSHVGIVAGVALHGGRNMGTRFWKARTRRLVTSITGTHS